jgi:uncharacterized protein YjiS (DUF1127 family)
MTYQSSTSTTCNQPDRAGLLSRIAKPVAALIRNIRNRRQMNRLLEMNDYQLSDIGLTRNDVHRALNSPYLEDPSKYLPHRSRRIG